MTWMKNEKSPVVKFKDKIQRFTKDTGNRWTKLRPTQRAQMKWESARFSGIFLVSSFFCSQAESNPAHQRVPTPAGRCAGVLRKRTPLGVSLRNPKALD